MKKISVATPDDDDLNSLFEWLKVDDDVTGATELSMVSSGRRPGAQSPLDLIDVILKNATAIASLLIAFSTWRTTRPSRPSITIEIGRKEITVENASDETILELIKALEDESDEEEG